MTPYATDVKAASAQEECPRNENVQNVQKRSGCSKTIYMIYPFTRRQFVESISFWCNMFRKITIRILSVKYVQYVLPHVHLLDMFLKTEGRVMCSVAQL